MGSTPGKYYQLTPALSKELRAMNLHASEWRLWSYLVTLDPFGDRYMEMPDLVEILNECDMSKATFYRALAKFEEHGLFDTQPLKIAFRNLRGQTNSLMDETPDSPMRKTVSSMRQPDSPMRKTVSSMRQPETSEPLQNGDSSESGNVPITDQTCLTNNKTDDPAIDRE
ncbi:MAG TPA: hypothetical protein V6D18_09850 [Thermosynechococcaceae cyanobacterium]